MKTDIQYFIHTVNSAYEFSSFNRVFKKQNSDIYEYHRRVKKWLFYSTYNDFTLSGLYVVPASAADIFAELL